MTNKHIIGLMSFLLLMTASCPSFAQKSSKTVMAVAAMKAMDDVTGNSNTLQKDKIQKDTRNNALAVAMAFALEDAMDKANEKSCFKRNETLTYGGKSKKGEIFVEYMLTKAVSVSEKDGVPAHWGYIFEQNPQDEGEKEIFLNRNTVLPEKVVLQVFREDNQPDSSVSVPGLPTRKIVIEDQQRVVVLATLAREFVPSDLQDDPVLKRPDERLMRAVLEHFTGNFVPEEKECEGRAAFVRGNPPSKVSLN